VTFKDLDPFDLDEPGKPLSKSAKAAMKKSAAMANTYEQDLYESGRKDMLDELEAAIADADAVASLKARPTAVGRPAVMHGSAIISNLEAIWAMIQANHPDVPDAVIITGSGRTSNRKGLKLGHHGEARWAVPGTEAGDPDRITEIFLSGERLGDGARGILSTLLHEAAHGIAKTRGIADTDKGHRYHNQRFVALAQEVGLTTATEPHPSIGWSFTECPDETADRYGDLSHLDEFYRMGDGTSYGIDPKTGLPRVGGDEEPTPPGISGKLSKIVCDCDEPRILRMSKKAFAAGPVICGVCREDFHYADEDEA
jgi:hypothetical protein